MNKTHITVYSQRLFDIMVAFHRTVWSASSFTPLQPWSSHLLAFQNCWRKVTKPLPRFHSSVINANVSILRLAAECMGRMRVRFMREFMKMFTAGGRGRRKKRRSLEMLSHLRILTPPLHRWRSLRNNPVACICARVCVYVAARYYRIILGYFTGT